MIALSLALGAGDRCAETVMQRAADAVGRVLAGACTTPGVRDVVVAGELLQLAQSAGALGRIGTLLRDPQVPMPFATATAAA